MVALFVGVTLGALLRPGPAAAHGEVADLPEVRSFLADIESRHQLDGDWLREVFRDVSRQQSILDVFARPAESKPWPRYRSIFLNQRRIRGGVKFIGAHASALERARERFGVPHEVVAAIIGVETSYGGNTGRYRVIDALATLAFFAPRRNEFFRRELEQFLVMLRDGDSVTLGTRGSYAGAIGLPQFIPSSYRHYAVDFDGDGRRDLVGNMTDAIGSVGAYLHEHGWRADEPVAIEVRVADAARADAFVNGMRPHTAWRELGSAGIEPVADMPAPAPDTQVALLRFDGGAEPQYWAGFRNFHVISRYNPSSRYTMVVHQLSQAIRRARERS